MNLEGVFESYRNNSEGLEEKFQHLPLFHSKFQIESFILVKDCVDEYGMYKKARNEVEHRYNTLEDLSLEYEKLILQRDRYTTLIEEAEDIFDKKEYELDLKEVEIKLKRLHRSASEVQEEFLILLKTYNELYEVHKDSNIETLETEHWLKKYVSLCLVEINKGNKN